MIFGNENGEVPSAAPASAGDKAAVAETAAPEGEGGGKDPGAMKAKRLGQVKEAIKGMTREVKAGQMQQLGVGQTAKAATE